MTGTLFALFRTFFRIGLFGFGGGFAMLPLIFQSVQQFGFMSQDEFSQLVALSQATPGPVAVNAATYVGFHTAGLAGATAATIGVCLPSWILVLIVMHCIRKFEESRGLAAIFSGIRPVTIGLIATAVIYMGESTLTKGALLTQELLMQGLHYFNLAPCLIFAATLLLSGKLKLGPVPVILLSAAAGAFLIR